jgi:hypothetical protein
MQVGNRHGWFGLAREDKVVGPAPDDDELAAVERGMPLKIGGDLTVRKLVSALFAGLWPFVKE